MGSFNRFSQYGTTLLYDATARASLRTELYTIKNTIEGELISTETGIFHFGYNKLPLYSGYSDDEDKFKFYLKAACLCYIPYDTAGYAYIREKLGSEPVAEYRCKNILRKLKYMGIHLEGMEEVRLYEILAAQQTNVFQLDAAGLAGLCLRVRTALEGKIWADRGFIPSLTLSKAYSKIMDEIAAVACENRLEEMDISPYLPPYPAYTLTDKDKEYLDYLFDNQAFPEVYEYKLRMEEYIRVAQGKTSSYLLGPKDKTAKKGDRLILTYDNLQLSAEITGTEHYGDYIELPAEKYGFNIGTYNPYFYDNTTVREQGGLTLADFRVTEQRKIHDTFTVLYRAHQLEGAEAPKALYLVRKEHDIYMHAGYSSEFILKECMGGPTIKAISPKLPRLAGSKEDLLGQMDADIPSIPTRKEIENGFFTDADFNNFVYLFKLEIQD